MASRGLARFAVLGTGAVLAAGALAPAAVAGVSPVVADCNAYGHLTRHYTVVQLRTALNTMPADVKEYTDCYEVVQQQLLAQLSGRRAPSTSQPPSGSGSGGSFLPTPLLVVLVVLAIGAIGFAISAVRRRR